MALSILNGSHCAELAYPHFSPTSKFGYQDQRFHLNILIINFAKIQP